MGIRDIAGKVANRIRGEAEDMADEEMEFEAELKDNLPPEPGEGGMPPASDDEFPEPDMADEFEETTPPQPTPNPPAPAPAPTQPTTQPTQEQDALMESLKNSIESLRSKLDVIESHIQMLESAEEYQKAESGRYMQELTLINEKLGHLEAEHSEIERMLQEKLS